MKTVKNLLLILLPLVIVVFIVLRLTGVNIGEVIKMTNKPGKTKKVIEEGREFCTIGEELFSLDDLEAFRFAKNYYPAKSSKDFFPGRKHDETLFIETEIFYNEAKKYKSNVHSGLDWQMKKVFLKGQMFARRNLRFNLGATDKQLEEFYNSNPNAFIQQNSDGVNTFGINKLQVIDSLFLSKNKAPEEFYIRYPDMDTIYVTKKWLTYTKENYYNFFKEKLYKEKYGKELPKKYEEIVGKGLPVSESEVSTIISWLPEPSQEQAKQASNKIKYAHFVLAWKLFSEYGDKIGYFNEIEYDAIESYFEKYTLVHYYLNNVLAEAVKPKFEIDLDNLKFVLWDSNNSPLESINEDVLDEKRKEYAQKMKISAIYEQIYTKRKSVGITFQSTIHDDKNQQGAESLFKKADSLRSSGMKGQALKIYRDLSRYYLYDKFGRDALLELAKEANSKGEFHNAISKYRDYIIYSGKSSDFCDTYFMIAYIYGEELKKYRQAAANYQWIIKNAPECNMVDDAEFMCLHLGEPMPDVDELRDQAVRQGQSIK